MVAVASAPDFCMAQARVTDMPQQSARSQTMSCLEYLTPVERISATFAPYGIGTYWCTYVEDGDRSYSPHHIASISTFAVHTELLSRRIWGSGQPFLSSSIITIITRSALHLMTKTTSLLRSSQSTSIVYTLLSLA